MQKISKSTLRKILVGASVAVFSFSAVAGCFVSRQCNQQGHCFDITICIDDPTPVFDFER